MLHYLVVCTAVSAGMGCATIPAPYPSAVECGKVGYEMAKSKKGVTVFTHCVPAPRPKPNAPDSGPVDLEME